MQNAGLNPVFDNPLAQQLRERVSKPLIQISVLNTSLVEQTATGLALGGSRNLTAAFDYIRHDRIGKTSVRNFRRLRFSENRDDSVFAQRITEHRMHSLINYVRWQCEGAILRCDHDRISQVFAVRHNAPTCPAANYVAIPRDLARLGKSYEVTEGNRRCVPAIKSQNCRPCRWEKDFVDRHVERSGTRRRIVNDNQFLKQRFRFPREFFWLQWSDRTQP